MRVTTFLGFILILLGLIFIAIPLSIQYISIENIPTWLVYVYEGKHFIFATSPILIVITILTLLFNYILNI